jgi:peptidoglycan/xylan/chitin deacetylase (PgdA/CDA1 family)
MSPRLGALVVIRADAPFLQFTKAADSVVRQAMRATHVVVATPEDTPVIRATAARIRAAVEAASEVAVAINRAVATNDCDWVLVVPPGFRLAPSCIERCDEIFRTVPDAAAILLSARLTSPDERFDRIGSYPKTSFVELIADPRRAAPVFAVKRSAWLASDGLDARCGAMADYDLQLRLAMGSRFASLDTPVVAREVVETCGWPLFDSDAYRESLRTVLEKHRRAIEPVLCDILVTQEEAYARLRVLHRSLVARRDRDAARLAELQAETSELRALAAAAGPPPFDWGDFARTDPVSRDWGYDRGGPIDRYYIEGFVRANSSGVFGAVLEVQEDDLSRAYGALRVARADVVDINEANDRATVLADLRWAPHIPSDTYDCIIITQTLHVIDDMQAVLKECFRVLKPGGTLLATFPAASRVCLEYGADGDLWRLTPAGVLALLEAVFGVGAVEITPYGNVQSNVAFLHGIGRAELTRTQLDAYDPYYPALTGGRAVKRTAGRRLRVGQTRGVVLLYHRVDDEDDVHALNVTRDNFVAQLRWLSSNSSVLPLQQFLATPLHDLPERAVALTFDDGYLDNLSHAAPLLDAEGLPATFFVTTRYLHEPGEYWWDLLERAFGQSWGGWPSLSVELGDRIVNLPTRTAEERESSHRQLHGELVSAPLAVRERVVSVLGSLVRQRPDSRRPLVADEVRQLAAFPGATIGAHTVNHLALPGREDDVLESELVQSRTELSKLLGRSVDLFAYPYGAVDDRSVAAARSAYEWAIACGEQSVPDSFDAALVPRVEAKNWDAATLASRIERAFAERMTSRPPGAPRGR